MANAHDAPQPHIAAIDLDGKRFNVSVRIAFDGIEYVGRLWFIEDGWDDAGLPDRGAIPGGTREEVISYARRLRSEDLKQRYLRALAEKRRFLGLRKVTEDILAKIRYLNQVALSMRAGLLDMEGAAQEIDLTERQLHDLIGRLREVAGVES
jgi:hypothetical protein